MPVIIGFSHTSFYSNKKIISAVLILFCLFVTIKYHIINEVKKYLEDDQRKKMLMTNYSFYSVILNQRLYSPTRWHIFDGTDYPQKNSNYFASYKNLLTNSIRQNNIKVIYTITPVINSNIYDYISKKCFQEKKVNEILTSYEIINCKELNLN